VDVCDDVMDKVGYPRGLIKFSTQNGMQQGWDTKQMLKRAMRPRVLVYSAILFTITTAVGVSLYMRTPLRVDVMRDRGSMARMVEQGRIENVYRLQIMNATEETQRYAISVSGLPGITLDPVTEVEVLPTEVRSAAVRVQIPPGTASTGSHPIQFEIRSTGDEVARVTEKAAFLVPR
jgi:polyferredoxin